MQLCRFLHNLMAWAPQPTCSTRSLSKRLQMQEITSQKKCMRAFVAGAMQIARLQHPVDANADEWMAFLCGNPRALVVRHDAVSRSGSI